MARTRQLRINDSGQIRLRLADSIGKIMHIVLRDNRVLAGTIVNTTAEEITLRNMRRKDMTIAFNDISEIYIDTLN